jgi:hypothetical protein
LHSFGVLALQLRHALLPGLLTFQLGDTSLGVVVVH